MSSKKRFQALLIAFIFLFASTTAVWKTSRSGFCNNCHEIRNDYAAWKSSSHSKVECVSCHVEPGIISSLSHQTSAILNLVSHISDSSNKTINKNCAISKNIGSEQCITCHDPPKNPRFGLLAFSHQKHSRIGCAFCHNRVAHDRYEVYDDRTKMESCIKCHEAKKVAVSCIACHPDGVIQKPSTHLTGDWSATHKSAATIRCYTGCHSESFCNNCHKGSKYLPASHKKTKWAKNHKSFVNASCEASCHTQAFCSKCHNKSLYAKYNPGLPALQHSHRMPGWPSSHKRLVGKSCTNGCHSKDSCDNCHRSPNTKPQSHIAMNWPTMHGKMVNGGCSNNGCHKRTFCDNCHRSGNGIPVSHRYGYWLTSHKSFADTNCYSTCHDHSYCNKCHSDAG